MRVEFKMRIDLESRFAMKRDMRWESDKLFAVHTCSDERIFPKRFSSNVVYVFVLNSVFFFSFIIITIRKVLLPIEAQRAKNSAEV